jgi:alpha-beta hydrolase superfamily lysophospholipase
MDVESVVDYIKGNFGVKNIYLWGRSMGAVTGLLYSEGYFILK